MSTREDSMMCWGSSVMLEINMHLSYKHGEMLQIIFKHNIPTHCAMNCYVSRYAKIGM